MAENDILWDIDLESKGPGRTSDSGGQTSGLSSAMLKQETRQLGWDEFGEFRN